MQILLERRNSIRGVTLIELMIAITLLGILLALAIPSFSDLITRTKIQSAASSVSVALATARSEAVKRGRDISVCTSTDSATCAGSNNWATGWVIYATAGTPIKAFDAPTGGLSLAGDGTKIVDVVTFTATGATEPFVPGDITVCKTGQVSKVVSVAASGRIRVASGSICP